MPNYFIWTIGCQMNQAESACLAAHLEKLGYRAADTADSADLIVVNSCVVRDSAETRAVNKLHVLRLLKKKRPELVLALTGCMVDSDIPRLKKLFPHIDHFFAPGVIPDFAGAARQVIAEKPPVAVYVPIMQGCNNFCSYCIVPFRRGRERSRPLKEIVDEVNSLAGRGAKEVTLVGQNVDSYGHDLPEKPDLADLLVEVNAVPGLARIRFLTNHPKDMSAKLIEAMAGLEKVCEQVNLPVQSGSNEILKKMKRGYTAEDYRALVARIRSRVPDVSLSTDVIVGYPSETAAQFRETFDLLSDIGFDKVHVAAYSPRPGTAAAREPDDVLVAEKKARLAAIEVLQEKIAAAGTAGLIDRSLEILVEGRKGGKWRGRTRTGKLVFFIDGSDRLGQLVMVKINRASPWSLQGRPTD